MEMGNYLTLNRDLGYFAKKLVDSVSFFKSYGQFFSKESVFPSSNDILIASFDKFKIYIAKDGDLRQAYYALRYRAYREGNGWKDYDEWESVFDKDSDIMVALSDEGNVIAGSRLMISDFDGRPLANEISFGGCRYKDFLLKENAAAKGDFYPYGEISALVTDSRYKDFKVIGVFLDSVIKYFTKKGCRYVFGVASLPCCRRYKMIANAYGFDLKIGKDMSWGQDEKYNNVPLFPILMGVRKESC